MLGVDNNSSNSAQESSPNQDSYDSSDDFSANKRSTSKKMARNKVFQVHMVPDDVFDQGHVSKKVPQSKIFPTMSEDRTQKKLQYFISSQSNSPQGQCLYINWYTNELLYFRGFHISGPVTCL